MRYWLYHWIVMLAFLGLGVHICGETTSSTVTVYADQSDVAQSIGPVLASPLPLKDITYASDVYIQEAEFHYLVGMQSGDVVSADDVVKAIGYLFKKNKFKRIILTFTCDDQGLHIHMVLIGFWTFSTLKLHGVMLGKDTYRQYYLLDPGERFDSEKHDHSLEKIKEVFHSQGYFDGQVESYFEQDTITKSIAVHLTLCREDKFSIGSISLKKVPGTDMSDDECQIWHEKIYNRFLKRLVGNGYNKKQLNNQAAALKRYLFNKGFMHVSITLDEFVDRENKKVNLIFTVQLHRKKEFIFLGNHFFSVEQLLEHVEPFGRSAWLLPTGILQQEIKELYQKKGFLEVAIESREEKNRCFFIINEGKRAAIKKVELRNVYNLEAQALIKDCFSPVMKKKSYDIGLLDACIDSLITAYVKHGYLDAKVVNREFCCLDAGTAYAVIITVDEGERSYFATIGIDGFSELENQGPFAEINNAHVPLVFDGQLLTMQRQWLLDYFHEQGYLNASVTPELTRHEQMINVVWKVQAGVKEVRFGKTIVVGSSTFPFEYIARELAYKEGQPFDKQLIKKSMLNLKKLAVFDSIHLYPESVALQEEKPIILKVQKDDPFELRVRVGFAAQQVSKSLRTAGLTYRVGGAFLMKNPFNYADQLLVEADVTRSSRTTLLQYRRPWFFNAPIRTVFQGYSNRYEQPGLVGSIKNLYDVTQQGFLVGAVGNKGPVEISMNTGLEWMETRISEGNSCSVRVMDDLARAIDFTPRLLDKNIPYILLEPTVLLDYVDNRLDARNGFFTLLSLKGMFPLDRIHSHAYFVRCTIEHCCFIPIRSWVGAFRMRVGHIFRQKLKNIVPIERFYLGGANSIRSYETDRCPPLGRFIDDTGCLQYVPRGGKTLININGEMRFPIYKDITGVVFQDLGFLGGDFLKKAADRAVLAGTGFGVRHATPIGPVRFDIAWKWRRSHPKELPYAWFVTLGHAF